MYDTFLFGLQKNSTYRTAYILSYFILKPQTQFFDDHVHNNVIMLL